MRWSRCVAISLALLLQSGAGCRLFATYDGATGARDGGAIDAPVVDAVDAVAGTEIGAPTDGAPAEGLPPTNDQGTPLPGLPPVRWFKRWSSLDQPTELAGLTTGITSLGVAQVHLVGTTGSGAIDFNPPLAAIKGGIFASTLSGSSGDLTQALQLTDDGQESGAAVAFNQKEHYLFVAGLFEGARTIDKKSVTAQGRDGLIMGRTELAPLWEQHLAATGNITIAAMATDETNLYIVGSYQGTFAACDPNPASGENGFVMAVEVWDKTPLWCHVATSDGSARLESVAVGAAGLFVAATSDKPLSFSGNTMPGVSGRRLAAIYKLDPASGLLLGHRYDDASSGVATQRVRLAVAPTRVYVAAQQQAAGGQVSITVNALDPSTLPTLLWSKTPVLTSSGSGSVELTSLHASVTRVAVGGYGKGSVSCAPGGGLLTTSAGGGRTAS